LAGYKFKDLKYTVSYPKPLKPLGTKGKRVGALADAMNFGVNKLSKLGLQNQIDRKLEKMYLDIRKAMKNHTGVLVVVQYQKWKSPDPAGNNPLQLLSIIIGPPASNRQSASRQYMRMEKMPMIKQGPDIGMVYGPKAFLWFTRDLTKKEQREEQERINKTEGELYWKSAR
jgi:hypothetical protein